MPEMCYVHLNGLIKVLEMQPGVYKGRQVFTVPLASGRRLRVAGSTPEEVIPQLRALLAQLPPEA